ncbi:YciI-like protein [Thalassotalea psychrophila]|uniref:YciI-like protein n=1 Tax=Thalassotalea psychrophila TaxID=3065647 RepID=A0ABY9TU91_9GAMM|nr:YciI-like protein [Colwelliaceae bacterium SQ149]
MKSNMYFLLTYDVVSDYIERRTEFRDAHIKLALSAVDRGELRLGGALTEPNDGAVLLFEGDSPDVAESFAKRDPYVLNGLVKNWQVRSWSIIIGAGVSPQNIEIST